MIKIINAQHWASRGSVSIRTKHFAFVFVCHFKCGTNENLIGPVVTLNALLVSGYLTVWIFDNVLLNKNGFQTLNGKKISSDPIGSILTCFEP